MTAKPTIKPTNELARRLLARLAEVETKPHSGFFGGQHYCLAVKVCNPSEAVQLGMDLGTGCGELDFDIYPNGRQFVVFRDAYVQL